MSLKRLAAVALSLSLFFVLEGCKKKVPPPPPPVKTEAPPPPPPPPAKRPQISRFTAEPTTVTRGDSSTLRWAVEDATEVTITPTLGAVGLTGTRQVYPASDAEYVLTAKGPGGEATASVRIRVTVPAAPPPPPPPATRKLSFSEWLQSQIGDVYFAYDSSELSADSQATLNRNASALKSGLAGEYAGQTLVIEGHCDERGSAEYNIGLGDRRATATKDFLVNLGVDASRLKVVSYGKEKPQCMDANEECYQRNRRAHFAEGQ